MMEEPFDPLNQVVTFLAPDKSPMSLPIPTIDAFNDESISICINYAVQVGACTVLTVLLLILTPPAKLRRPSALLHLAALLVCIVRLSLLLSNFLSPLNHFYQFWAIDYSSVPRYFFHVSVASNAFSLLLVVVVESALMHQAWTMVRLWPSPVKLSLCFVSAAISLLTVGWKFAFAIMQSQYNLTLDKPPLADWVMQTSLIMSTISIFWYCALFNAKLVMHLVVNRAILRSPQILTPMEVLVITNGVLMIVPGLFAGLEWGRFPNFEAASFTLTSVAIILPLGTLTAQQLGPGGSLAYLSGRSNRSDASNLKEKPSFRAATSTANSGVSPGVSVTCGSDGRNLSLASSCKKDQHSRDAKLDHYDLELRHIDSTSALTPHGGVRVDTDLEQQETRI